MTANPLTPQEAAVYMHKHTLNALSEVLLEVRMGKASAERNFSVPTPDGFLRFTLTAELDKK